MVNPGEASACESRNDDEEYFTYFEEECDAESRAEDRWDFAMNPCSG